jgi:hypothetical protein
MLILPTHEPGRGISDVDWKRISSGAIFVVLDQLVEGPVSGNSENCGEVVGVGKPIVVHSSHTHCKAYGSERNGRAVGDEEHSRRVENCVSEIHRRCVTVVLAITYSFDIPGFRLLHVSRYSTGCINLSLTAESARNASSRSCSGTLLPFVTSNHRKSCKNRQLVLSTSGPDSGLIRSRYGIARQNEVL